MRKIMILGAGVYQAPLIRQARSRGLYTLAVSPPGNYPGLAWADQTVSLDTRNREAIVAVARKEGVCAVATTGTDVAMPALGAVCDALGLPGICLETALRATDKIRMKEAFRAGNVHTSDFRAVRTEEEALRAAEEIGYPVMMKIPDKSGSRGITKAESPESLREAWCFSRQATEAERLLVEGFTAGTEFGIDAVVQKGRLLAVIPHEKRVLFSGRTGVPGGHLCPADFDQETEERICRETERICRALGLEDCAVNVDAMLTPAGEISVIEAAARCGGTGIPEVIGGYLGVNWYDVILDLALGIPVKLPQDVEERRRVPGGRSAASLMITSDRQGRLRDVSYEAGGVLYRNENYDGPELSVSLNVKPGDTVNAFVNGTERLGQAVFRGKSREEVLRREAEFLRSLKTELFPD